MALAIDLFCGLGGWANGLLAEGYEVVGFDIERHDYGGGSYPGQLVIQDVLTLHGSQFKDAAVIVASPPCQKYSYMGMPWSRAKALADWYQASPERIVELNALFNACFRIQRETCEAAGRHIPLVVENVCKAQRWVGPAKWHYGSYYLWGDVPALMPIAFGSFQSASRQKIAVYSDPRRNGGKGSHLTSQSENLKNLGGKKQGGEWWHDPESLTRRHSSKSIGRKAASAEIAKIPLPLAQHIARTFKGDTHATN
jgi:hypothetical protein